MTETYGYMCPKCLSWWTAYLNKNDVLYCHCEVPKAEWIYVYRKTYGNWVFGVSNKVCKAEYKEKTFRVTEREVYNERARDGINKWKLSKIILQQIKDQNADFLLKEKNLIYIALKKALTQKSGNNFSERCPKCEKYNGYRNCKAGHDWHTPSCSDFNLKPSIKEFLAEV